MVDAVAEELYVTLEEGKVSYLKQGQGHPLVMLHSADFGSWTWNKVIGPLAKNFQCYALDMPGYDRSDTPTQKYSIERFVKAILEFMDKVGISETHLMGNRTGAVIAFEQAVSYPQRVNKLVLEGCPAWNREEGRIVWEKWLVPNMNEYGGIGPLTYEEAQKSEPRLDRAWVEKVAETSRRNGRWVTLTHEAVISYDMTEKAAELNIPTLLVYGEEDLMRKKERLNADIRGSQLKLVPECATPHYESPEAFLKEVTSFLLS